MKIEYPSQEEIQRQKNLILAAAMPEPRTFQERIRETFVTPGLRVIFYQCNAAWLIMGMVYLLMIVGCILSLGKIQYQLFLSFLCCPLLYLAFFFVSLWSEEQTPIIELKQTMRYSFTRLISLRMFYSSIVAMLLNLMLLGIQSFGLLHGTPGIQNNSGLPSNLLLQGNSGLQPDLSMTDFSLREMWAVGAAGISSMFLFATLSLYLYQRLNEHWHTGILLLIWVVLCTGIWYSDNDTLWQILLKELPLTLHLTAACGGMILFTKYAVTQGNSDMQIPMNRKR